MMGIPKKKKLGRPKPMTPKAGLKKRRYANGGKVQKS